MEIIVGFKEHSQKAAPFLIYLGAKDRHARAQALANAVGKGFVRVRALRNPQMFPVKLDEKPESRASAEAEAIARRDAEAKARAQHDAEQRELVELRSTVESLRAKIAELEPAKASAEAEVKAPEPTPEPEAKAPSKRK
jgi:hypothetical protein